MSTNGLPAGSRALWLEPDDERLAERLTRVGRGELTERQVAALIDGDLDPIRGLSAAAQNSVLALARPDWELAAAYERVQGNTVDFMPIAYLDIARAAARSVGRIIFRAGGAVGTGVLISDRLVLTNNHVIATPEQARAQSLQLNYERDLLGRPIGVTEYAFDPETFFMTSPEGDRDYTIVALGAQLGGTAGIADFGACPLSGGTDKHAEGDFVTIVQHPDGEYKQIVLRENRVLGRGAAGVTLYYGTDTLPGSSGSPVFNDQYELVALHHAGAPMNDNQLEDGRPAPRPANEGIRVSAIVADVTTRAARLDGPKQRLLADAMQKPGEFDREADTARPRPPGPSGPPDRPGIPGAATSVSLGGTSFATNGRHGASEVVVPLEVRVSVQAGAATAASVSVGATPTGSTATERNKKPEVDYDRRDGYDPQFLGVPVPLPDPSSTLRDALAVSVSDGSSTVFDYWHFSLSMYAPRRMPLFTAVNIHGPTWKQINRDTRKVTNPFEQLEAAETWYADQRVAPEDQLCQEDYSRISEYFDRGHMVRREDPQWGDNTRALAAMDDTFHFTNSCPQNWKFNQSASLWQGIENYVLSSMRFLPERVTVFSGPIFDDGDPVYGDVQVPLEFWKIVARINEQGVLRATGFLASQEDVIDLRREALPRRQWPIRGDEPIAGFQARIAAIEERTGLIFDPALHNADTLEYGFEAATHGPGLIPIRELADATW
jgi:endonuclease G